MDHKFDGPDLYAVVGSVAGELIDLSDEVVKKVDKSDFNSELRTQHLDVSKRMIKDLTRFKLDMEKGFNIELRKMKSDYDSQIRQVQTGWIGAFGNMKEACKDAFSGLRSSIYQLEADNKRSLAVVPPPTGGHAVNLTEIHEDIDRLQDRLDDMQAEMANLGSDRPESISYQNLGFSSPEEANA